FVPDKWNATAKRELVDFTTRIDDQLTTRLRDWAQRQRTTLMMTMLTAFIAAVARWSGETDVMIWVANRGRFHPAVEATVGGFACLLPLRIEIPAGDRLHDLRSCVTAEYARAQEHADFFRTAPPWQ